MKRVYESSWPDLPIVQFRRCYLGRSVSPWLFKLFIIIFIATPGYSQQQRLITGKVTHKNDGIGLPGVNVVLKGTAIGTATDVNGSYTLSIGESSGVLIFSFVGFETHEIVVGGRSTVDVLLVPNITQLSEVTITGTGVPVERRKLAFAVESVTSSQLPATPTSSLDQALIGRIPGAQISSIDGTPGAEMSIMLRGINTINRGTMPMIMVDGVQMGATLISSIDVSTIDKVEVIQGAAASSIYGAQGANGVIQIFTKRGKAGKMAIDFTAGWSRSEQLNVGGLRKGMYHAFDTNE
ncbi:MAG TPA: TonB-dependent receptor plug domain-containing protein, partial [Chryseolinea sp.]|nr:TonB-dependent receptor plug domain-containing protein [Chryseolinea sp.]